ncbi:riboflavin-specific deaminase [Pseudomonas eucalypticola]|uniref:Riboflavin-specific deaminase n=2 Tax=Pseudomonas eucalypticola TaxID=2599595 RepID=A0A7D5D806_9PSED|nr:riboflavin-specific deaminase [Pseudomonas eucalypticola]
MDHSAYMLQALEVSQQARPKCSPNPPVGCVIVQGGQVVATGYTQSPGHAHAEIDAMSKLTGSLEHCTLYVTLEPCSFHGRTPACALQLIERGVKKVYVAMVDPHVKNQGKGIALLRAAGVEVQVGLEQTEVSKYLRPYLLSV